MLVIMMHFQILGGTVLEPRHIQLRQRRSGQKVSVLLLVQLIELLLHFGRKRLEAVFVQDLQELRAERLHHARLLGDDVDDLELAADSLEPKLDLKLRLDGLGSMLGDRRNRCPTGELVFLNIGDIKVGQLLDILTVICSDEFCQQVRKAFLLNSTSFNPLLTKRIGGELVV